MKETRASTMPSTCSDEDEPPLLDGCDNNALDDREIHHTAQAAGTEEGESTVMEEMIRAARDAKQAKRRQQEQERNRSGFGAGLKKGFFQSKRKHRKASSATSTPSGNQRLDVSDAKPSRLLIAKSSEADANNAAAADSLVLPDVQDAMKPQSTLLPDNWMDARFLDKLKTQPHLLQALQNPRFMQAMQDMQRDPAAAVRKYQHDPDVSRMLQDFMGFLGSHFETLAKDEQQQQQQQQQQERRQDAKAKATASATPAIVDLDAARRQAIATMPRAEDEEAQVQQILQDPALLAALSDTGLMERLRRCAQDPSELRAIAADPKHRDQLRLLVDAGLVRFA